MQVILDESSVPVEYRETDSVAEDLGNDYEWETTILSKYDPDEKDVRKIKLNDVTMGFLIPINSLISTEHDLSDDKYFRRSAYQAYIELTERYPGERHDERSYILVCWYDTKEQKSNNFLLLSLCKYGIYPYYEKHSLYQHVGNNLPPRNISVVKSMPINELDGYMKQFIYEHLPAETNQYARFMFLYQVIELFMDILFHSELDRYKSLGRNIGSIREKISELSSARKLITILFQRAELPQASTIVRGVVNNLLGEINGKNYEEIRDTKPADVLYDFRNAIVHNYYRLDSNEALSHILEETEAQVVDLLINIMTLSPLESIKNDFESRYLK